MNLVKFKIGFFLLCFLLISGLEAQDIFHQSQEGNVENLPVREYHLSIKSEKVNRAGKEVMGMTINGTIPGPTLSFTEGEYAVIYVKNEMEEETSVHWHGLLLPNFFDGVPYLTTPPIAPGATQKYEFALKQSGTYWYHSHTMLQEQSGVYGSIVIHPKEETLEYDKELVLLLSDWTNEKPMDVLRFLKRGTEWYNWKKGTATPLNRVIARGAFGAQVKFWKQRMEGADIADIYYPAFLVNGFQTQEYPQFKPGERVRLRIINGAASTQFWMTFGGEAPFLVAADGLLVEPIQRSKSFIAIAETYDFLLTIPEDGKTEIRFMAQDGSGIATAYLGQGTTVPAEVLPRPDQIGMMMQMAKMDMRMGAPALKLNPKKDDPHQMMKDWGMQMEGSKHEMNNHKTSHSEMAMDQARKSEKIGHSSMGHDQMGHSAVTSNSHQADTIHKPMQEMPEMHGDGMEMFSEYNYDFLKSTHNTKYDPNLPVNEILLNLTGNMGRYIWSMNGVPLSETDKIRIKENQVTRITFNNLTMMHHPMHLHGHFFRVINEHGEYSPLKHTVNVPPMQKITLEFYGNEYGDWFFHCHILYHMMGGMARVVSYDTPRNPRLTPYPVSKLIHETNQYYTWGVVDLGTHMAGLNLVSSNIRNQFNLNLEYGWNQNMEAEFSYEYYLYDYLRIFGGINLENSVPNSLTDLKPTAVAGIRWFTPYMFNVDLRLDNELRPRIGIGRSLMLFPRFSVFGYYEYQVDFGWVNTLAEGQKPQKEVVWSAGGEYMLSRNFSLMGSFDNRFGLGGGLSILF